MSARSDTRRTWLSQPPTLRSAARSTSTIASMPGRCTFSTTRSSPVSAASPGRSRRPVRLPEGCCGDRRLLDRGEHPLQRRAQLSLGEGADRGERNRRHLVLQPLEFLGDLGRQHVEPGGQELADLDHEAAEVHREHMEALREAPHPLRPGALGNPAPARCGGGTARTTRSPRDATRRSAGCGGSGHGCPRRRVPDLPGPGEPTSPPSVLGEDRVQPAARLVEHRHGLLHLLRRAGAPHLGRGLGELDAGLGQRREPGARRRTRRLPGR